MAKRLIPPISIRHKILIILICYVFGILAMSIVSQEDLYTAKEKLEVVELAYSLNTLILEVRRYEKNFLLYGTKEALEENYTKLDTALHTVDDISSQVTRFKVQPMLVRLKLMLLEYQKDITELAQRFESGKLESLNESAHAPPCSSMERSTKSNAPDSALMPHNAIVDRLRQHGQDMTEMSKKLVHFEHVQIRTILETLVEQLLLWTLVSITIGIFLPIIVSFKIFRPLRIIKEATEDIAMGRFNRIEVLNTQDEMQQVMEAFNTMVAELERRQTQLVQSQKLSSIGTLSAGIAHQLNNPLNNISTSCQIAKDEFDSDNREMLSRMLRNIEQETYRARDVVQGLLEFSRAKEFALQEANLHQVVSRAVKLVRSQIPAPITIDIDIPESLTLPMDGQRIQEVLINMFINASHAIEGRGIISVTAGVSQPSNEVVICIADTGTGIAPEIRDRLFDPFYTTKEEGKGTGLGLSIAYGIVQKHHGTITVDSVEGEGATFHIRLPLQPHDEEVKGHG